MAAVVHNRFHVLIAFALALVVFVGFSRTFYLGFLFNAPPHTVLVHLHGIVFTAWMILFIVQTRLIAAHRYDLHMKFGITGVAIAAAVVVIGVLTVLAATHTPGLRPMGFTSRQFSIFPLGAITLFAIFVGSAIALRRRRDLHKRLMVLAMISVLGPPVARILRMFSVRDLFLYMQIAATGGFVAWALINDWVKHRVVHPVYAVGGAIVVLSWPLRAWIAGSEGWTAVSQRLYEMGTFLVS